VNSFGRLLRFSIYGESHGRCVGVSVDGVPAGVQVDMELMLDELARRRPGQGRLTTQRSETDTPNFRSGVYDGFTTGAPITLEFPNKDVRSKHYDNLEVIPRPGHADYPAHVRHRGFNDHRGGGHFSGRLTAPLVAAGCLARMLLKRRGVTVGAHVVQVGNVQGKAGVMDVATIAKNTRDNEVRTAHLELASAMANEAEAARKSGDSIGAVIEFVAEGMPVGVGEPWADPVESHLAHLLFAIPAVKGVSFGAGFAAASMRGSAHNDPWLPGDDGDLIPETNNAGGILGGNTTGAPIWGAVCFKPASSIFSKQKSVDLHTGEAVELQVKGRHDPLIALRAVPVVEAAVAFALADLLMCFDAHSQFIKQ
jgi:chorismate synthase